METDTVFNDLITAFSKLEGVDSILLGGSRAVNNHDALSDYDIYVYTDRVLPLEDRKQITDKYCQYMELNNQFWETEDDGILKTNNIPIDIIYRSLDWIEESLNRLLFQFNAETGYTTALWYNFLNSKILFDADGRAGRMQEKFSIPYPQQLKTAIIQKNLPLLKEQIPAYIFQIEKAIKRKDLISINHRLSEFFASYFDIIFAVNELPHPGEKKIIAYLRDKAKSLPENMASDIENIIRTAIAGDLKVVEKINQLIDKLEKVIEKNLLR